MLLFFHDRYVCHRSCAFPMRHLKMSTRIIFFEVPAGRAREGSGGDFYVRQKEKGNSSF